jgi:hypothetical protein
MFDTPSTKLRGRGHSSCVTGSRGHIRGAAVHRVRRQTSGESTLGRYHEMSSHFRVAALPFAVPVYPESKWRALALEAARYRRDPQMGFPDRCFREILRYEHWSELEQPILNGEQFDVGVRLMSDRTGCADICPGGATSEAVAPNKLCAEGRLDRAPPAWSTTPRPRALPGSDGHSSPEDESIASGRNGLGLLSVSAAEPP